VRVRVRPETLPMALRLLAPSVVEQASGGPDPGEWPALTLRFPAEAAARGALLGFATDVEVVHPPSLRRSMAAAGRDLLALYGDVSA
jgi:hypothetical protein